MKELIFIKIPSALLSTILPIYLLSIGFSNYKIGIFNAISVLSAAISSFYFSYRALKEENIKKILVSSLFAITISTLGFFYLKDFSYILLSCFLFYFYYNAYLYFLKVFYSREGKDIKEMQSKFEFLGGIFYVFGLLLGFFLSRILEMNLLIIFSAGVTALGMVFLMGRKEIERRSFLEILDEFSEKIKEDILRSFFELRKIKISRRNLWIHISTFLIFFSLALFDSQFQIFLKEIGFSLNFIFLIYFFRSSLDAFSYRAAKIFSKKFLRILVFLSSILIMVCITKEKILAAVSRILLGIPLGIFFVLLDSKILEDCREEFGVSLIIRNVSGILGSYICGIILEFFSFKELFLISSSLLFFSTFLLR